MIVFGEYILCVCGVKIGLMKYLSSCNEREFLRLRTYLTYRNCYYKTNEGLIKCRCCHREIGKLKEKKSNSLILIPVKHVKQVSCGIYIDMKNELVS